MRYNDLQKKNLISKLESKLERFAIQNFMTVIVGVTALVFVLDYLFMARIGKTLSSMLYFNRELILAGEVWRIFTFILLPPSASAVFIIFALYMYWLYGSALESNWGAFRFNLFYFLGMLGTIAVGFIFGVAANYYLNLSLFLAFALLYPDFEVNLFFILPIKVKYIAFADLLYFGYLFVVSSWPYRVMIIVSLINVIIFFWSDLVSNIKRLRQNHEMKKRFRK